MRYLQISKARGVAVTLLATATRETLEAGRRGETHKMAIERTALALKIEGTIASVPWVIADTIEHMFRLDFLVLMQIMCHTLKVPVVKLDNLLTWLKTGNSDHCPAITTFYTRYVRPPSLENDPPLSHTPPPPTEKEGRAIGRGGDNINATWSEKLVPDSLAEYANTTLTRVENCLYITDARFVFRKQPGNSSTDARVYLCDQVWIFYLKKMMWTFPLAHHFCYSYTTGCSNFP